jgi:broad specificity phosphatase PhoE
MISPNRIVLVRHGETVGESSSRYHGATDVALSELGREQVRRAYRSLPGDAFPLVLTSPLSRAWESARLLVPNGSIRLLDELREIDFGDWEGLTAEEIRARDPVRYEDWQSRRPGFEYPGGEPRAGFEERVHRAVDGMLSSDVFSLLVVGHKGVIRTIARRVVGEELPEGLPDLGAVLQLTRDVAGRWLVGRRTSGPEAPLSLGRC